MNGGVVVSTTTGITGSVAFPVFVSTVALIVAVPAASAVTIPVLGDTLASDGVRDVQMGCRPVSTSPVESRATAVAFVVCPTTRLVAPSDTETFATGTGGGGGGGVPPGFVTVNGDDVSDGDVIDPVMCATPALFPAVTTPVDAPTVATGVLSVANVTGTANAVPAAFFTVANSVRVRPGLSVMLDSDSVTDAGVVSTGGGGGGGGGAAPGVTVSAAEPVTPETVAKIVVDPAVTVETMPLSLTSAIVGLDVPHEIGRVVV